jgi:drug/metabolite transporter (DMT)-like permease
VPVISRSPQQSLFSSFVGASQSRKDIVRANQRALDAHILAIVLGFGSALSVAANNRQLVSLMQDVTARAPVLLVSVCLFLSLMVVLHFMN